MRLMEARARGLAFANEIYGRIHFAPSEVPRDRTFYGVEGVGELAGAHDILCLGRIQGYPDALEVGGFWVRPDRRGHGLAQAIVAHVLRELPVDGRAVYCIPFAPLVPFYGSFGFAEVRESGLPSSIAKKLAFCRAEHGAGRYGEAVCAMRLRSPRRTT
jgi:GNAT superfamily N-acetyltransferase